MKKFTASLALALVLCLTLSIINNATEIENVTTKFVRLHVIANSDSDYDQELKLKVRDKTLEIIEEIASECQEKSDVETAIYSSISSVENEIELYLESLGCTNAISVDYGIAYVDKREYDGFSLPAGRYTALTVRIGEAKGKNWWCVLFPSLCSSCAVSIEESEVFTKDEIQILTKPNEVKYKLFCYEIVEKIKLLFLNCPKIIS